MSINIDLNGIKNSLVTTYHTAAAKTSEWMGRAVIMIRSGIETGMPYLQDKRIAIVSLIAVTLILGELANIFTYLIDKHSPNDTSFKRGVRDVIEITVGVSITALGVTAFAQYTKLPLSPLMILAISAATIFSRACLQSH